uniref:TIFA inhibitor n=2 Tax=Latimeria chalumnae TaxID=7897 RepID=H3AUG5_LATCH
MEEQVSVLNISLHHPEQERNGVFSEVPAQLQQDLSPIVFGRGADCTVRLQHQQVSRRHLQLEPYLEKGDLHLRFSLKNLSRKSSMTVNGTQLWYLHQVPLSGATRVLLEPGIHMLINLEPGISSKELTCRFHLSQSPLITWLKPEESKD